MKKLALATTLIITLTTTSFATFAHQINSTNNASFPTQDFILA
ncbi:MULTISPECIES: hypothetical protein [Francisella]|nr:MULTISPECIES: hypothetical protein [Francisella]APC91668.1 hypothetical protein BBG19_0932 [Francisella sp. MA067296]AXH31584.1 hypothetical protein CGC44_04705 [Francisella opportunistica]AXH33232.1 hypothetical protein CGC45_04730 [Francisella opportunistica]